MREQLGVRPDQCTTESYGMLFLDWKARMHSPAENLTFDEITENSDQRAAISV